jgi:O-antigen biosynthesis protein WbqP
MKLVFDVFISIFLLVILIIPIILLSLMIKLNSSGNVLFWSERIGKDNIIFSMPKFRTMKTDTPQLATHLLRDPESFYTPLGKILRKYSLDELPQIFSVIKGDMSLVGPRPALFNQYDLMELRKKKGVDKLKPGITGLAQINGRDEMSIPDKVRYDEDYLQRSSMRLDLYILWLTLLKVLQKEGVSH